MPESADEHFARGDAFLAEGRYQEALGAYDRALGLQPDRCSALNNRGVVLRKLGRDEEALACFEHGLALHGNDPGLMLNRAAALRGLARLEEALGAYESVLALYPDDFPQALIGRGIVFLQLDRPAEAILSFDRATVIRPDSAAAEHHLASALRRFGNPGPASEHFGRAHALEPERDFLLGDLLLARRQVCDWRDDGACLRRLAHSIANGERASSPFPVLALLDSPVLQRKAAETYSAAMHPAREPAAPALGRPPSERIRVGYFSTDFHNHPVAYLTAELFELHDRARFEVFGFSLGRPVVDAMRVRLAAAFDHFLDVGRLDDQGIARRSRELGIDIAIDLGGYTDNSRTGIFSHRAAPIQASYLGYLGTMGAAYYDYLFADTVIVPRPDSPHYSERIVRLPSYQVNDRRRRISDVHLSRCDEALPERAFVFCCFNSSYKIAPDVFDCWMRILSACEGSMLWLFSADALTSANLGREAAARGIDPGRLVFAPRRDHADHLARYRLADLFLDTLPCNAGTTASDALWAGVPVLTRCGEAFAGRVAASLLHAVGLPELVTHSADQYVELAVALAGEAGRLDSLRARLAANRETCLLFDSRRFTKTLESAFLTMQQRYEAGLAPESFDASSTPATGHRLPTLSEQEGRVTILDQTRLPHEATMLTLATLEEAAHAIRVMQVRGAPLIGATAAYGVAIGLEQGAGDERLAHVLAVLGATRPTAVNLHWALARMERVLRKSAPATRREIAWREARAIAAEDKAANHAIGMHGMPLLQARPKGKNPIQVMTHCNAGRLATVEHGTAISPIYAAHAAGLAVHVWVSETRPRNQGLLTAWELAEAGVPHTLIADNAAGLLLMQGKVDLVIVGADRIAANGDTANKVGTYLKALAARAHQVPFYVAAPLSTIDFACPSGKEIPIEERSGEELGVGSAPVANPAFDVTPAALITGIISERGVAAADNLAQWRT